jgi:hypothetical protein
MQSGLQNRLTACLLSPNLTAYKTDALPNISVTSFDIDYLMRLTLWQTFIKDNSNIFKVPSSLFEDVELSAIFATIVSDLLSSIRGGMKSKVCTLVLCARKFSIITQLISSIRKRLSIMDTSKSLAHGCIEVDAAHWNRIAFLVCFRYIRYHRMITFNISGAACVSSWLVSVTTEIFRW